MNIPDILQQLMYELFRPPVLAVKLVLLVVLFGGYNQVLC